MEGTRLFGIHDVTLVEEVVVPELLKPNASSSELTANLHPFGNYALCCGRSFRKC